MKIHEYQAKEILKTYGVPVPQGHVAYSVDEAMRSSRRRFTQAAEAKAVASR
jgi:succinyl-CoA synthetase beta subunit